MFSIRPEINLGRRNLSRRAFVLGTAQLGALAIISSRLYYLHVTESKALADLSERNRISIRLLIPERGLILDRNGTLLAANEKQYRILMTGVETGDTAATLEKLSRIVPITPENRGKLLQDISTRREHIPTVIIEEASWEQVASVSANAPSLPGVEAVVGDRRIYPMGADLAHLVGYVSRVSPEEMNDPLSRDPLLQVPDFRVGKTGVERYLDKTLRGRAGHRRIEVNASGRVMRKLGVKGAQHGPSLQLTVDSWHQNFAAARLSGETASGVVMNVQNGDILAMVSVPSFDPNKLASKISQEEFDQLLNDERRPLFNRPTQGIYPPGSTFKMITALAALESGVVTPDEVITCTGSLETADRLFHCWKSGGHGEVDLQTSLSQSCDVYYYELGQRVGIEKINEVAQRFGIGERPQFPLPSLSSGLFPTRDWKLLQHGQQWVIGDTLNAAIGQGFVLASALQLTIMTARIATGRQVEPRLVLAQRGRKVQDEPFKPLPLVDTHLDLIREGMVSVVNQPLGTAYMSRTADESFIIAGKTGTSQVRAISSRERTSGIIRNEDLPFEKRDHALFCCYAPSHAPRYAATVIVEHGGSGSAKAAPLARDLIMWAQYGGIPPLQMYPPEVRDEVREQLLNLKLRGIPPAEPTTGQQRV